jgi:hypothetical protein
VTGSLLEDPSVPNEALDLEAVFAEKAGKENDEDEDAFKMEFEGFCVYGDNIYVYGTDGLFALDLSE